MSRRRSGYEEARFSGEFLGPRIKEYRIKRGASVIKLANEVGVLINDEFAIVCYLLMQRKWLLPILL